MTAAADPAETAIVPDEEGSGRGHIGLIVLCSIAFGLILGLVLVLGVFGGGRENVITGAALISLALGMLMLFELARRRTDQPQPWALAPAVGLGVVGLALLVLGPGDRMLGWLGWVWPLLLAVACRVVVCGVRAARFTTGRGERFSIRPSSSWDWSPLEEHSRPSPRRRRVTSPRLVARTSSPATVSI